MNNRPNKAALIALLAVFASALIAVGVGIYRVKAKTLNNLNDTLATKQREVEQVRLEVKRLPELEAEYEQLYNHVSILEPSLPTEAYIPTFLSQLQTLATETNNRVILIKPKPKRKVPVAAAPESDVVSADKKKPAALQSNAKQPAAAPYDEIDIEVGLEGTYWTALAFLEELRAFPKMIAVNDLSIKPERSGKAVAVAQPFLQITVDLTAVIAKEK